MTALVGLVTLVIAVSIGSVWALTVSVSLESENGTLTMAASVADSTASSGHAVRFGVGGSVACPQPKRTIAASDVVSLTNSGYAAGTGVHARWS